MSDKPTWTVLIINPNRLARATLARQLVYYGYQAWETDSARYAISLVNQHPRTVDLLLVDTGLTDAPYANAIQVLQKIQPNTAIILVTDETLTEGRNTLPGVTAILKKPMRTDRMLSVIAKALGRT